MISIPIWLFVLFIIACVPVVLSVLLIVIAYTTNLIEKILSKFDK